MVRKLLCCTDNLLVLPVSGVFMSLLGLVLLIICLVARGITTSLHLVIAPSTTYLAALLTIVLGIFSIILLKKRHIILICLSILLSVVDLVVCIVHAARAALVSIPFLGSFSVCVLRATSAECQCYIFGDGTTNSTVIVPGDGTKHYTFQNVKSCRSIEMSLTDFLYTLCIVYSFGAIGCMVTGTLSTLLLCSSRRSRKEEVEEERRLAGEVGRNQQMTHQEDEIQGRNSVAQRSLDRTTGPRTPVRTGSETVAQVTSQGARPQRNPGRTPERPVRRSASVTSPTHAAAPSAAATPSSTLSSRPIARFHSVTGASGESASRQRPRIPVLIRGGYLQSHVNGPRIPVYMVNGSNESYIALTDLPKLQLPALSQVPAYVRDLPDLPNYEPPPYSPTAEALSESPEMAMTEQATDIQLPPARQCLFPEDALSVENELQDTDLQPAVQMESPVGAGNPLSGDAAAVQLSRNVEDDQLPREMNGAAGRTNSLSGDQLDDEQNLTPALITDDNFVHDELQEGSESDTGIVNPVFEEETDNLEDINRPPDILLEAIESARSSMNTTANIPDTSTNSIAQDDRFLGQNPCGPPRSSPSIRVPEQSSSMETTSAQAAVTLSTASEPRQDANVNQQRRANQSGKAIRAHHPSTNLQEHSVEPLQRFPRFPNNQGREEPTGTLLNSLSRSTDARSKEVKRSRSLSAARNTRAEYPLQDIPSMSKERKRRSETYGRQRKLDYGSRTKDFICLPEDRNHGKRSNPVTSQTKVGQDKARQRSRERSMSRQSGSYNAENLSDILNLVEAVHGSPSTNHSSKKKKKRKPSRKECVAESRI